MSTPRPSGALPLSPTGRARNSPPEGIERIFAFNALGAMSMGGISQVSISSHKFGIPSLVRGITGLLFREQEDSILAELAKERPPSIVIEPAIRARLGMTEDG